MKYTEYGLQITIEELEKLLENAKNEAKYHNMQHSLFIKGGEKPKIIQYCCYAECNPTDHTYLAR